jgi:hypothetical protein
MNISFRTGPEVLLFHLLDYGSEWSPYTGTDIANWLRKNINEVDLLNRILKRYVSIRAPLSWDGIVTLYSWAYQGFPPEASFLEYSSIINEFKNLKTKENSSISELCIQKATDVKREIVKLQDKVLTLQIDSCIKKLDELFPEAYKFIDKVPTFIAWLPTRNGSYGAAQKNTILIDISIPPSLETNDIALTTIVHEYFHIRINPKSELRNIPVLQNLNIPEFNTFIATIEELIVYSSVNVHIFKTDPEKEYKEYYKQFQEGNKSLEKYANMWRLVSRFAPIMIDYFSDYSTIPETREKIIAFAIENNLYSILGN